MDWEKIYQSGIYDIKYPHGEIIGFVNRHVKKGDLVLDVGCGLGNNFQPIIDRSGTPIGFDISEVALEHARKRYPESKVFKYKFDDKWNEIEDKSISVAIDGKSLCTVSKETTLGAMQQIRDKLQNGGKFLWWPLSQNSDWARAGAQNNGFVEKSEVADIPNQTMFRGYSFYSYFEILDVAKKAGFKIDSTKIYQQITLSDNAARRVFEYFNVTLTKVS